MHRRCWERWSTSAAWWSRTPARADRRHLELAATIGLEPSSVGRVRMDEGLVGLAAERLAPVVVANATRHPRFKYFPEAGEDLYRAFLGVPMLDRGLLVGVVVVQTIEARGFTPDEVRMVAAAAGQFAPDGDRSRGSPSSRGPTDC